MDLRFILGAKPSDHTFLFDWVAHSEQSATVTFTDAQGVRHRFRYLNCVPLNDANFDLEVNFIAYWEQAPDGTVQHFSWVTDLPISEDNLVHQRPARIAGGTATSLSLTGTSC